MTPGQLSRRQRELLDRWLPGAEVVKDKAGELLRWLHEQVAIEDADARHHARADPRAAVPGRPSTGAAFLNGYGPDPREPEAWHRNRIREAIGTAVWAYRVHDEPFEQQGRRMIAEALAR